MGGKSSPPATPDYLGAAQAQAGASKEITNMQTWANRPTINTPFGSQSWSTQTKIDPATGQPVTDWTQNTQLAPGMQEALNAQVGTQLGRSQLAGDFMNRVQNEYSTPFDWQNLPQMASLQGPASLNTNLADYTPGLSTGFNFGDPQTSVNSMTSGINSGFNTVGNPQFGVNSMSGDVSRSLSTGDNPALPQFDSSYRDRVAGDLFSKMQPVHERQQGQLETQLANQGYQIGTEGYTRALSDLQGRQAQERFNALDQAGSEAQRLYNMGMGSRQQAFNEDVSSGNFANQATQQAYGQNLGAANFGNQALQQAFNNNMNAAQFGNQANQQAYNQNLGAAQFGNQALQQQYNQNLGASQFQNQALGQAASLDQSRMGAMNSAASQQQGLNQNYASFQNQLRQQAIAEQMQRRGMSLNEMNALLTGQQVGMPQMPSFSNAQASQTPNIMGATQMGYDAALQGVNAQNAQNANMWNGLGSLASTAFMFSDRRLKSRIKRVGTHAIGVGIYEYTMMGMPQRGVIAQEVEAVRPDLVKRHASGYLMVNYSQL